MNPEHLEWLAEKIQMDLDRREKSSADWIDATVDLCADLHEARQAFTANQAFGDWCAAHRLLLDKNDRAAAIIMGSDIPRLREVLAKTDRRSLRHIESQEFRLSHVTKTDDTETRLAGVSKTKNRRSSPGPKRKKAGEVYDRLKAEGIEPTVATMVKESGFSRIVVEPVIAAKEAVEDGAAASPKEFPPEMVYAAVLESLSSPMRAKLEAGRRAYAKQLSEQFDAAVAKACRDWSDTNGLTMFNKRLDAIENTFMYPRNAVMTKLEYNVIMRCLHPDTGHSRSDDERGEAFRLFTKYKLKMVNDPEEREAARRELRSQMPKTLAEMLARRKATRK